MVTNKYNGYDVSYALIRYMVKKYDNTQINDLIRNKNKLLKFEKTIIQDFINETKESAI